MAILGGAPISSVPISGLETAAAAVPDNVIRPPYIVTQAVARANIRNIFQPIISRGSLQDAPQDVPTKPVVVLQAIAPPLRPPVQTPIVTGGHDGVIVVADILATKPVVVLQDGKTKPVIPAITSRGSLVDEFVAPYTFQNITQAIARPLFPTTPAPIISRGSLINDFVAPYTFQNITQAIARPLFPTVEAPIIVRGGEDAVVVENQASPDPVVVSQAIARPLTQVNFAPIIRGGTQDVPFAPYTFNNVSQAVQSRLRQPPMAAVIVKGGEVAVVSTASPLPVNISQAVARSLNPTIFGAIIIGGHQDGGTPPEPPVEEEDRGKSGKRVYEDYDRKSVV